MNIFFSLFLCDVRTLLSYCTFNMLYPFLSSVLFIDASDECLHVLVR